MNDCWNGLEENPTNKYYMIKRILIICMVLLLSFGGYAKNKKIVKYSQLDIFVLVELKKYKNSKNYNEHEYQVMKKFLKSFLVEQQKFGVPVSVSMAQLFEESGGGTSFLAKKAKNLFGRKSFSKRDKRITRKDDVKNDKFKVFHSHWFAIRDRSIFLKSNDRYSGLFKSTFDMTKFKKYNDPKECFKGRTDPKFKQKLRIMKKNWNVPFIRWCYGLDVVGYATDNEYGENLVKRIQKKNWNRYDHIKIVGI